MQKAVGLVLSSAFLLSACGGGGGGEEETLYVSVSYPNASVSLYQQVSVAPQTSGFNGRTPNCTLIAGGLPSGLSMGSDCVVTGRVMHEGMSSFMVRVGARGVSNTLDFGGGFNVAVPWASYMPHFFPKRLGEGVSDRPNIANWAQAPDLITTWNYSVTSGTLPPGLTLDASNGTISGTALARGSFNASIQGTLTTQFGTYTMVTSAYSLNVDVPMVTYDGFAGNPDVAYISQSVSLAPTSPGGLAISNLSFSAALPAGLASDAQGAITGVPTGPVTPEQRHDLTATLTAPGGFGEASQGYLYLAVRSPLTFAYRPNHMAIPVSPGDAFDLSPTETRHGSVALPAATRLFREHSTCSLPPGTTLDPATGRVQGTAPANGAFDCRVEVDLSNNGVSWTESAYVFLRVQ